MTARWMRQAGMLVLGATLVISGCKSKPAAVAVRNQDGSITNPDGSVTYPAGSQQAQEAENPTSPAPGAVTNSDGSVTVPPNTQLAKNSAAAPTAVTVPAPATTAPARVAEPAPAPRPRPELVVPTGTRVEVSLSQTLSAKDNNVGDSFSGVLARPIQTADGTTVFPRGTAVAGTVVAAKGRGRFKGAGDLGIQVSSIGGVSVETTEYEKVEKGKGKRTAGFIGGGGGLGALIGGLAGGGKGALIGGLAGAGAGTAAGAYTGNKNVVLPAETVVTFRTTSELRRRS